MELVTITDICKHEVKGKDENGTELPVSKFDRIPDLKVGDLVQGHLLNNDTDLGDFYLEAVQRVYKVRVEYMITGTIDMLVKEPDLENVEKAIADEISDATLLRGIDNDGCGIDGDQIIIRTIESIPDDEGNNKIHFDAGHILNS
ncbi:hypothetical protein EHV15_35760 [Paenibacillus oralis]|uniref:Uncharacterized protein n=1 Tax=Paenibacillus oralis TaxID=2490856 RepID=A0A3P3TAE9_9BACL|nr:hypothetical protein [Paenibacillus oralis]RRJ54930.1 hypothetical protein EHV15_35760 [Paenibacillus oralis]